MSRSVPVQIGGKYFPTQIAAKTFVRKIVSSYENGQSLDSNDFLDMMALFQKHSEIDQKKGVGVKSIVIRNDGYGNRCFYLHRLDGTEIDISWVHCISQISEKTTISLALRREVEEQIRKFRDKALKSKPNCVYRNIILDRNNSHVDHNNPSFEKLVSQFEADQGIQFSIKDIEEGQGPEIDHRGVLRNDALKRKWQAYHRDNANLRLISKIANLSDAKKGHSSN